MKGKHIKFTKLTAKFLLAPIFFSACFANAADDNKTEKKAYSLESSITLMHQSASKIDENDTGGKFDIRYNLNLDELGWMKGARFTVHGEANFGHSLNGKGGLLMPVNVASAYPGEDGSDRHDLSSVYVTKFLSKSSLIMVGKINMFDHAIRRGSGGAGLDYFMNTALVAAPTGFVPPTIFGGLYIKKTKDYGYTAGIYDADDWVNKLTLSNGFKNGTNFLFSYDHNVEINGNYGTQGFKIAYSTKDGADLESLNDENISTGLIPKKDNRYFVAYTFKQFLFQNKQGEKDDGFGIFGQIGISDGNPSSLDRHIVLGVGGNSLTMQRPKDRWGFGYFRYKINDPIEDNLDRLGIPNRNESGFEAFYNVQITDSFNLTADIQYVKPVIARYDNVVIYGLRAKFTL